MPESFEAHSRRLTQVAEEKVVRIVGGAALAMTGDMQEDCPFDTGFLRNSAVTSVGGSGYLTGEASYIALLAGLQYGQDIEFGYVASYARHVHDGARGRSPRPCVRDRLVRWPAYVEAEAARAA